MACVALLLSSCAGEFNKVYKSQDYDYRYEYAKQSFAEGKYGHAVTLLEDMVAVLKGHNGGDKAQESLYMLAMAQFMTRDYESASETFKKYTTSYPKGDYAEKAFYYVGESLFESAPSHASTSRLPSVPSMPTRRSSTISPIPHTVRKPSASCSSCRTNLL